MIHIKRVTETIRGESVDLLKLVIVDDERILLQGLVETYDWEEVGFKVVGFADSGEKALEVIKETKPDLVLSDIRMKRINGLMVMEEIMNILPDTTFIFMSAHRDFEYAQKACEMGAYTYLLKPVDDQKLMSTVKEVYDKCIKEKGSAREIEVLKRIVDDNEDLFINSAVRRYLVEDESEEKLVEVLTIAGIENLKNAYFVTIGVKWDITFKMVNPNDYYEMEHKLNSQVTDLLKKDYNVFNFKGEDDNWYIILLSQLRIDTAALTESLEDIKKKQTGIDFEISKEYADVTGMKKSYVDILQINEKAAGDDNQSYIGDYIEKAIIYINDNVHDEELSIVLVAAHVGLNPVYFGRLFKKVTNMTFKKYLIKQRMELAQQLIRCGENSIAYIGERVGIPNPSYFSQVFKQYTGVLPTEYKKECD